MTDKDSFQDGREQGWRDKQAEIERLRTELALWQRQPTMACDGKCKDEECYCGWRAWDKELTALRDQQYAPPEIDTGPPVGNEFPNGES